MKKPLLYRFGHWLTMKASGGKNWRLPTYSKKKQKKYKKEIPKL